MNQTLQTLAAVIGSLAALLGGLYVVVTAPLIRLMEKTETALTEKLAEMSGKLDKIDERLKGIEKKVDDLEVRAWRG